MGLEHTNDSKNEKGSLQNTIVIFPTRADKFGGAALNGVFVSQILNLFGVITKLAQPRLRVFGKGRGRSLRRAWSSEKENRRGSRFVFRSRLQTRRRSCGPTGAGGRVFRNAQNASRGNPRCDQRLLPLGGAAFHQFRGDFLIDRQTIPPASFPILKTRVGFQLGAADDVAQFFKLGVFIGGDIEQSICRTECAGGRGREILIAHGMGSTPVLR